MNTRSCAAPGAVVAAVLLAGGLMQSCATAQRPPAVIGTPAPAAPEATPAPAATPAPGATPEASPSGPAELRSLERVEGAMTVSAWTEPRRLPPGGGQAQLIVRVLKPSGRPLPGVEVRITSSSGKLFSESRVLTTDARGMVRDSLTTSQPATITVEAGGLRQRVQLPIGETLLND
jgi:hypothetical protein